MLDTDKRLAYITLAIVAIIIATGAFFVYFNAHGDYSADIQMSEEGKVTFSVSGVDAELMYSLYSGTDLPEHIYLYYDESYKSDLNTNYQQKEFFDVLKKMLERRNYSDVSFCNASELKTILESDRDCGVFFVTGALPETVYRKDVTLFQEWMESGGTVYWAGPEIGRYVSTKNGVEDLGTGFFNGMVSTEKQFANKQSDMFKGTKLRYDVCDYGLSLDVKDSLPLGYVNDRYSAVTAVKLFNGNAIVYGGNIAYSENISHELMDRTSCADLIISGLTHHSSVLSHGTGKVSDGRFTAGPIGTSEDVILFIGVGTPATSWSIGKVLC